MNAALHVGIAEQGKLHALAGDHDEALRHYREAIRLAVGSGAPEVCFRHYTQCVLESLEHMGSSDEILAFCERVEAHYTANPPPHALARLDRASAHERRGVVLLKHGDAPAALAALALAVEQAGPGRLPLAEDLLGWLRRGMQIDARRVQQQQARHRYFIVERQAVRPERAIPLPKALGAPLR
jgi:tetratricopeptide (TPR) repeat protein